MYITLCLSIHLSNWDCLCILALVKNVALNIGVLVPTFSHLGVYIRSGTAKNALLKMGRKDPEGSRQFYDLRYQHTGRKGSVVNDPEHGT